MATQVGIPATNTGWRLSILRGAVYVVTTGLLLYGSPATDLLFLRLQPRAVAVNPVTLNTRWGTMAYMVGWLWLLGVMAWTWRRSVRDDAGWQMTTAFCALSLLYLADILLSTSPTMPYHELCWVYWVFSVFFITTIAFRHQVDRLQLLDFMLVCVGIQAVFAIAYYLLDINQFITPGFGRRTSGTFFNPNVLYPVTLMGTVLAFHRGMHEPVSPLRWMLWGTGCLSMLATMLTFTRVAWIALALWLAVFAHTYRNRLPVGAKSLVYFVAALVVLGTVFVRTGGRVLGNPQDRSFWGRWQIWMVSSHIVMQHPILGHGFQTYLQKRDEFMTPALKAFDPRNTEAKNLLLNEAVEFGLVGVCLLCWSFVATWQVSARALAGRVSSEEVPLYLGVRDVLVVLMVCGLADTPVLERYRIPSTWMLMVLLGMVAGSSVGLTPFSRCSRHSTSARWRRPTVAVLAVLLSVCLIVLVTFVSGYVQYRRMQTLIPKLPNIARSDHYTPLQEVAPVLVHAVIASEDGNFYQHHGVDWQALHRALRVNIRSLRFRQGGSTITMQTARYLMLGRQKSVSRKIAEVLLALEMEKRLSKERILELYLNSARFGLGAEDIGTACQVYFGKKPSELTLAEAAFLAGVLPEPPRTAAELTPEKVQRCKQRALSRLQAFFPLRYSPAQIEEAMNRRLTFAWDRRYSP